MIPILILSRLQPYRGEWGRFLRWFADENLSPVMSRYTNTAFVQKANTTETEHMSCSGLRSRQAAGSDEQWWKQSDPVFQGDAESTHSDQAESCGGWQTHVAAKPEARQGPGRGRKRQGGGGGGHYETQPKRRKNGTRSESMAFEDVPRPKAQPPRRGASVTSPSAYIASGSPVRGTGSPRSSPHSPTAFDLINRMRPGQEWQVGPNHEMARSLNDLRSPLADWSRR